MFGLVVTQVPPVVTITDIAGLVKGASEGAGLGNAFLSHIQVRTLMSCGRPFGAAGS